MHSSPVTARHTSQLAAEPYALLGLQTQKWPGRLRDASGFDMERDDASAPMSSGEGTAAFMASQEGQAEVVRLAQLCAARGSAARELVLMTVTSGRNRLYMGSQHDNQTKLVLENHKMLANWIRTYAAVASLDNVAFLCTSDVPRALFQGNRRSRVACAHHPI